MAAKKTRISKEANDIESEESYLAVASHGENENVKYRAAKYRRRESDGWRNHQRIWRRHRRLWQSGVAKHQPAATPAPAPSIAQHTRIS